MNIRIATPKGYECNADILAKTQDLAKENGTEPVFVTNVADEAVKSSDVIVTDTCKILVDMIFFPLCIFLLFQWYLSK